MKFLRTCSLAVALGTATPAVLAAQSHGPPDIVGIWEVDTPDGPDTVVVRPDSSAVFGQDSVRWRIEADTIFILFDEWIGYHFELDGRFLTLSGGDLEEPVTLTRIGPAPGRPSYRREDPPARGRVTNRHSVAFRP